jgi:hypothetical protein
MTHSPLETRIVVLRWAVGVVVLLESIHFTITAASGHHLAKTGLPQWFWVALGAGEAVAALLFLIDATRTIGAYALLVIFVIAGLVHILHGEFDIGALIVYAVAVAVSMAQKQAARVGERV